MRLLANRKVANRVAWAAVALCVLPFVALSLYAHPALDDFGDAVMRRQLGFVGAQRALYLGWTGRFATSLFLTEFSPLRYNWLSAYCLVPLGALALLSLGLYALITSTNSERGWTGPERALAAGIVLSLWLVQAPSLAEALYWYNSVAVYMMPVFMVLVWLVVFLRSWSAAPGAGRVLGRALAIGLAVALVGTNEILAFPLLFVLGGLFLRELRRGGARRVWLLAQAVAAAAAAAVAFTAPGNYVRLAQAVPHPVTPWHTAATMVGGTGYVLLNWLSSGVLLAATLLAVPALARWAARGGLAMRWLSAVGPGPLAAGLLLLLFAASFPTGWAAGDYLPLRARSAVYLLFVLGWFAVVLAALARYPEARRKLGLGARPPLAALGWAWLLLSFLSDHNTRVRRESIAQQSNNVVVAYRDWLGGSARRYDAALRARYRQLQAAPAGHVQLAPLPEQPATLFYGDVTSDPAHWSNVAYAQYFGRPEVRVVAVDSSRRTALAR